MRDRSLPLQRTPNERATRHAVAIIAMTEVDEHWLIEQLVADGSASAPAGDFLCHGERPNESNGFFSSARRCIPTSGDASRAIRDRLAAPSRPDDV